MQPNEPIQRKNRYVWLLVCMVAFASAGMGCSDDGGDKDPADSVPSDDTSDSSDDDDMSDSSSNDGTSDSPPPNKAIGTIVAIGDSITAGSVAGSGSPYPSRVAGILGTKVINKGSPGAKSSSAPGAAGNALSSKPSHVMILFGTNDVFDEVPSGTVGGNIASAISKVRSGGAVPVVGTLPPNRKSDFQQSVVNSYNGAIRNAASSGGARLANVAGEMGSGAGLLLEDGFHPNSSGTQIIAFTFADSVR